MDRAWRASGVGIAVDDACDDLGQTQVAPQRRPLQLEAGTTDNEEIYGMAVAHDPGAAERHVIRARVRRQPTSRTRRVVVHAAQRRVDATTVGPNIRRRPLEQPQRTPIQSVGTLDAPFGLLTLEAEAKQTGGRKDFERDEIGGGH